MATSHERKIAYINLLPGDPAPRFHQRTARNPSYSFDTAAGRYLVLCFFASAADAKGRAALDAVFAHRAMFDDERFCFFGVSLDPEDEARDRVKESIPGIRFFWDLDGKVGKLYGSLPAESGGGAVSARLFWVVIDPTLRVLKVVPFEPDGSDAQKVFSYLEQLPPPDRFAGVELQAPILFLPNVFELDFCQRLIAQYEKHGGEESGFMRDVNGKTTLIQDHSHKRRKDFDIEDEEIRQFARARITRRIAPELKRIFSFDATRMERYIVSCYAAEDNAHFRAHRDNTTKGTAHRRFAVSINLNADFEGGEVSFPEYSARSFKPPPGGAVVFPCALLHAVSKVTSGRRYAFLPFLYDEAAAKIREANSQFMADGGGYKADRRAEAS
jgi:peroxiredoxin/predicted 2-oxoglutarate/Fe(II)-dependent dioxygenase YbiX